MTIKDKLVECIARNIAKERYGNSSKSDECYIEAEDLFKQLLLRVLIERSKNCDPLEYVECLEDFSEICNWDYYYINYIEKLIFGD